MHVGQAVGYALMQTLGDVLYGCTLTFYSGTMPSTPETALSGNTALAQWTFGSGASISNTGSAIQNTQIPVTATATVSATGTVAFARVAPQAWSASKVYLYGQVVMTSAGNMLVQQSVPNGTSGTTQPGVGGGADGSCYWTTISGNPVGASAGIMDLTVATSGGDITVSSTSLTAGNAETLTFSLNFPVT